MCSASCAAPVESRRDTRADRTANSAGDALLRSRQRLRIHFLEVGQGDCTFIECPVGKKILIDCGSIGGGDWQAVRNYLLARLDPHSPRIDTLVLTHPDQDHYNLVERALVGVEIGFILMTGTASEYTVRSFDDWLRRHASIVRRLRETDFDAAHARPGYCDCGDADVRVLAADVRGSLSPKNTRSIVLKVTFGDFDAILTGDATFDTEDAIMARYNRGWLDCDVLKIGHHGSDATSTSLNWVDATRPETAVVSAGYQNRFAHPRKTVIQQLEPRTTSAGPHPFRWGWSVGRQTRFQDQPAYMESIYAIAVSGNIVVTSDGSTFQMSFP